MLPRLCAGEGASPVPRIEPRHTDALEVELEKLNQDLPALENFVLPGGAPGAARLNLARAVCRRAERIAARFENRARGMDDVLWDSRS